jgi:hypothetical protein
MTRTLGRLVLIGGLAVAGQGAASAQMPGASGGNMPDAKQMSGMPLPASELAPGTVVVRVVRGTMANPIAGQAVELLVAGSPRTLQTNDTGRAEFTGLAAGSRVTAVATVNGERIASQEIQVPATGGIRVALVATDPDLAKREAEDKKLAALPAQPGMVVLGEQSRFVIEMGDEGLHVFNLFEVVNTARTPVQPPAPLVFDAPAAAQNVATLKDSSPQATVQGKRVTVTGPFAPGTTLVQFAYAMPVGGDALTVEMKLPAALNGLSVMAQRVGDLHMTSPQMTQHGDMPDGSGQTYIVGNGPALRAGDTVTFNFTGLPHHAVWPRNLAIALAVLILAGGAWQSTRGVRTDPAAAARRKKLETKRDRLFGELTALEEQNRQRRIDAERYRDRRHELVTALERVYAELDEAAAA